MPGYIAATVVTGNPTPSLKSTTEATIQQCTPMPDFIWENPGCFGCNATKCCWRKDGEIVYPHRDRPGVRERALRNFKKLKEEKAKARKKNAWDALSKKQKVSISCSILANTDNTATANFEAHMAARRREQIENEGLPLKQEGDSTPDSTVMCAFPCPNANPAGPELLPASLDADFPHVIMHFGEPGNDNLVSKISCLVDSGADCLMLTCVLWRDSLE